MGSVASETTGEAQLYERHSQVVYRYCLRMLGTREDAEDAAQTTFVQALRALRRGVLPSFEQAWLLTIARNECKSRYRAGSRRRRQELAHDPQSLAELAEAPNGSDGRLVGLQQALARLPEMQRRALLLREWQGRSYADIAHELGVTRPAVEALLFRARRGLARELGEETGTRRHAFDVASLLGAHKAFLGGSAGVNVVAAIAAVATVGTVAAGSGQASPSLISVQEVPAVARTESTPVRSRSVAPAPRRARQKREALARRSKPATSAKAPAPGAPRVEQSTPQAPPARAPAQPAVLEVPAPQTPQLPRGEAPQLPAIPPLPPVPQVNVPEVPQVPAVPALPDVLAVPVAPAVPDLPALPDVPSLP
jgi:RNA polymerase sigma factor (sigma-70 family)